MKLTKLSVKALAESGGFVSRRAVEKDIAWTHEGQAFEATVNVLPLSYRTARSDLVAAQLQGDALAGRIASCIVDDDGAPVFTVADITGEADPERGPLSDGLTHELLRVIGEASGLGKHRTTTSPSSPTKTNSGTSSSSTASAATRSKKRKSASPTTSSPAG